MYLGEGEEQGHVTADALLLQVLTGSDALPGGCNLLQSPHMCQHQLMGNGASMTTMA